MNTYTFLMSFRGATFISQLQSTDVKSAMFKWAKHLFNEEIKHLGAKSKSGIFDQIEDETPIPLTGLKAAWYTAFRTKQGFILCNIIQTDV